MESKGKQRIKDQSTDIELGNLKKHTSDDIKSEKSQKSPKSPKSPKSERKSISPRPKKTNLLSERSLNYQISNLPQYCQVNEKVNFIITLSDHQEKPISIQVSITTPNEDKLLLEPKILSPNRGTNSFSFLTTMAGVYKMIVLVNHKPLAEHIITVTPQSLTDS